MSRTTKVVSQLCSAGVATVRNVAVVHRTNINKLHNIHQLHVRNPATIPVHNHSVTNLD